MTNSKVSYFFLISTMLQKFLNNFFQVKIIFQFKRNTEVPKHFPLARENEGEKRILFTDPFSS